MEKTIKKVKQEKKVKLKNLARILDGMAKQMKIMAFNRDTSSLDTIEGVCVNGDCLQINLEPQGNIGKL